MKRTLLGIVCVISILVLSTSIAFRLDTHSDYTSNDFDEFSDEKFEKLSDLMENKEPDDQELEATEMCLIKLLSPSVTCIMKSLSDWNISPNDLRTRVNSRPTCCAIWEMTDCMVNNAKLFCDTNEMIAFEKHMNGLTEKRNQNNCTDIPYQVNTCSDGFDHEVEEQSKTSKLSNLIYKSNDMFSDAQVEEQQKQIDSYSKSDYQDSFDERSAQGDNSIVTGIFKKIHGDGNALDEISLAKKLLDRVDRITVNQMVIELHPVKNKQDY